MLNGHMVPFLTTRSYWEVHECSSNLPSLAARLHQEPTTIVKRPGWPANVKSPRRSATYVLCPFPPRLPIHRDNYCSRVGGTKPMPDGSPSLPARCLTPGRAAPPPVTFDSDYLAAPATLFAFLFEVRLFLPVSISSAIIYLY